MKTTPRDLEVYTLTGVIGIGAVAGVYFLVKNKVQAVRQTTIQETGLQAGTAANWAKRLKMAFDNDSPFGWGTDEQACYAVFKEMPNRRAYGAVQSAYRVLYTKDLNADLQEELGVAEFNNVMKIYNSKPA